MLPYAHAGAPPLFWEASAPVSIKNYPIINQNFLRTTVIPDSRFRIQDCWHLLPILLVLQVFSFPALARAFKVLSARSDKPSCQNQALVSRTHNEKATT
jgi:hypothetical protein